MHSEFKITWDNAEETVIRYDFPERWTWEGFFAAKTVADAMIDATPHHEPIGVLFVGYRYVHLPPNVLNTIREGMPKKHPRAYLIVVVCDNAVVKALFATVTRILPSARESLAEAPTLEAARELLQKRHPEAKQALPDK